MKTLNISSEGRMPLYQKDLDFLQNSSHEIITALIKGLGIEEKYFIVQGCRITVSNNKLNMTSGWFYHNGDILPVRSLTNVDVSGNSSPRVELKRIEYYVAEGVRNFVKPDETTAQVKCYSDDYLRASVIAAGLTVPAGTLYMTSEAWTLEERIRQHISHDSGSVTILDDRDRRLIYRQVAAIVYVQGYYNIPSIFENSELITSGLPYPERACTVMRDGDANITITAAGGLVMNSQSSYRFDFYFSYIAASEFNAQVSDHGTVYITNNGSNA